MNDYPRDTEVHRFEASDEAWDLAQEVLGFTGTRNPITPMQRLWLHAQLAEGVKELHHGACVNADHEAHRAAIQHEVLVIAHPPVDKKLAMTMGQLLSPRGGVTVLSDKPYHVRNRNIVDSTSRLLALPDGEQRPSGTWYTVEYAASRGKPVSICYPDGSHENRYGRCMGCGKDCDGSCGLW